MSFYHDLFATIHYQREIDFITILGENMNRNPMNTHN